MSIKATFLFILLTLLPFVVQSEPWMANRFAENCASCHSPGRRNVEQRDRRCTITCQSCHTNPNGGGIRNEYGTWNQQRWLRSYKSEKFKSKGMPAPYKYQKYAHIERTKAPAKAEGPTEKLQPPPAAEGKESSTDKHAEKYAAKGAPLVVLPGVEWQASDFTDKDFQHLITAQSRPEFMARLTEDDPYRLERDRQVTGGGNFRYLFQKTTLERSGIGEDFDDSSLFARALDLGIRYRPAGENLQLVFEHRYLQEPVTPENEDATHVEHQSSIEKVFYEDSQVRSAYVLMNNLPWNTHLMYGLYRPLFGHDNPDHTTLLNNIRYGDNRNTTGNAFDEHHANSSRSVHKAFTFGFNPSPVSVNVHWIQPTDKRYDSNPFSQEQGFAANVGVHTRSFGGLYVLGSWWATEGPRENDNENLKNSMYSLTTGFGIGKALVNIDYTAVDREFEPGGSDAGSVSTVEAKYRVFREMYGVVNYSSANVARNLKKGSATELSYGLKSFLYPGTEFEVLMINREDRNEDNDATTSTTILQAQAHLFF
jgi:hypothetical protein